MRRTALALQKLGINYWLSLILVPIVIGAFGAFIERVLLRRLTGLDHLYSLLFTFGLALVLEGIFRDIYGSAGLPYPAPASLSGLVDLGFMRLPIYRVLQHRRDGGRVMPSTSGRISLS